MKFIQFYEYFENNSYTTYTVAYKECNLNEDKFTSYFLNINPNVRLSLSNEYRNEKTILVTPRIDTLS